MLERATLFFWPIQKFTANGVSLVMKMFLYGKTFLRSSLRSCVYKYRSGVREEYLLEESKNKTSATFVISFLRKYIVHVKLLSKLSSPEGQMMLLINTHSHTCLPPSLVSSPRAPPGEKRSGKRSRIPWACSPKWWKTNEIARLLIIT